MPIETAEDAYYRHLATIMHSTRGARFTAASSLGLRERWSVATTAFLSVFILAWSVFLIAQPQSFDAQATRFFAGLSIVASVSVLVLSLLDYAYGRAVRAEKLQENALQISILMRRLERELCSSTPDLNVMREIADRYENDLAHTQVNHSPADYKKFRLEAEAPSSLIDKTSHLLRLSAYNLWYYAAPVALHLMIVTFVLTASIWYVVHH